MASKLIIDRIPPDMHVDEEGNIVWTPRLIDYNAAAYSRGHVVTSDEFNTELIKQTYQGNYNTDTISVLIGLYNDLKTDVTNTANTANTNAAEALLKAGIAEANSIEALGTANDAFTTSTEALSDVQTAVNASVEAVTTSENALNISESAMSLAEDASDRADAAVLDAEEAMRIAEIADDTSVTAEEKAAQALSISQLASLTANSANTKSDSAVTSAENAVKTANEALKNVTESLGTQVTVGGQLVRTFNADSKLDAAANAVSATKATQDGDGKIIKNTYTKLDGSNYHAKLTEPSDNGNVAGWRHIASFTVGKWAHAYLSLAIKSRHSGTGLLTIGICDTNGGIETVDGSIRFYGSTDAVMAADAWKMIYNTSTGATKVYWKYTDYNTCEIKVLAHTGFTCHWNSGEWLTTAPVAGTNEIQYLPVIYNKEYLPIDGNAKSASKVVNALTFQNSASATDTFNGSSAKSLVGKVVDMFTAQTVGGNKTFSGNTTFNANVTLNNIYFKNVDGTNTAKGIWCYGGDSYGNGIAIGAGGSTILGSGESASAITNSSNDGYINPASESTHILSDTSISFYSNCQTWANRKVMTFNTSGALNVPGLITATTPTETSDTTEVATTEWVNVNFYQHTIYLHNDNLRLLLTIINRDSTAFNATTLKKWLNSHGFNATTINGMFYPVSGGAKSGYSSVYGISSNNSNTGNYNIFYQLDNGTTTTQAYTFTDSQITDNVVSLGTLNS